MMNKPSVSSVTVSRISNRDWDIAPDLLAVEEPMEIKLEYGGAEHRLLRDISVTMRTPGHDFELAAGFLFTEGIIHNKEEIRAVRYCTEGEIKEQHYNAVRVSLHEEVEVDLERLKRNFYTTSSCGICGKKSIDSIRSICPAYERTPDWNVDATCILSLPGKLREAQRVFEFTGGIHAAAIFDLSGNMLMMREDVGRHNALDKLIGAALMAKDYMIPLQDHLLLLSGRASFELLQKAAMAGIRMVCAVGAPSSLAVDIARELNITLIGFLRDNRFNIYSGAERIKQHG